MKNITKKICVILIILSIIFPVFASAAVLAVEDITNTDEKVEQENSEISNPGSNDTSDENTSDNDDFPKDDLENNTEPSDSPNSNVDDESKDSDLANDNDSDVSDVDDDENINTNVDTDVMNNFDDISEDAIEIDNSIQPKLRVAVSNQILADGTYVIKSALNNNMAITINGGKTNNGANVELWNFSNLMYQKFDVKYVNGYYEIKARHSGKSLDVSNAGMTSGTNVQQCLFTNNDAQKWILKDAGNGYYYIMSKCNNLYLDVFYASTVNGTNIQMCAGGTGNRAQMFKFEPATPLTPTKTLEDGIYQIHSALNENYVFDISGMSLQNGGNLQLLYNNGSQNQKFQVKYLNDGYYEIRACHSNKSLDVYGAYVTNGTNVQQYTYNGSKAQRWIIKDAGNGYYNIISQCSELYLDVYYGIARNNSNIQTCVGGVNNRAQMFKFKKIEPLKGTKTIDDGLYQIHSALNENFVMEVANGSKQNGGNIQISTNHTYINQKFIVRYLNDGFYEIRAYNSNKSLDVYGAGIANGTNVQQYTYNGSKAQRWVIRDAGNGYYYIISQCNELYLDVYYGLAKNGTNIQTCAGSINNRAQMFKFKKLDAISPSKTIDDGIYQIQSGLNINFVLDIDSSSKANGANLKIWRNSYTLNQKFDVRHVGNGYYEIKPVHSAKSLDVHGAGIINGTNVQQYTTNHSSAQRWIIKDAGNGYYNIISQCNELYLDVSNGLAQNGTNIQLCQGSANNYAQMFKFVSAGTKGGIDVSQWQGNIDWATVKASGLVDFAIIRVGYRGWGTEGTLQVDPYFVQNVRGAAANGINIGLYFFTQATSTAEAIEEANFVLNLVRQYNVSLTYPIFIDTEDSGAVNSGKVGRADNLDVWTRTQVCKAFVNTIEAANYKSGIYASRNWFYEKLNAPELDTGDIWLAHYTYDINKKSNYKYRYHLWQYSNQGYIPGINGRVDINVAYY